MRALTGQFRRDAKAGLMTVEQPELAAQQFAVLINPFTVSLPSEGRRPASSEELVNAGVRLFLRGVLPR